MKTEKKPVNESLVFRILALVFGSICLGMGWEAISRGYLWHTGFNAKMGTQTTTPTLLWAVYGVILILAGIFPWKWVFGRRKR